MPLYAIVTRAGRPVPHESGLAVPLAPVPGAEPEAEPEKRTCSELRKSDGQPCQGPAGPDGRCPAHKEK